MEPLCKGEFAYFAFLQNIEYWLRILRMHKGTAANIAPEITLSIYVIRIQMTTLTLTLCLI